MSFAEGEPRALPLKLVPFLILALAACVIGYGTRQRYLHPAQVLSTATFRITGRDGTVLAFPQRVVAVAAFEITEVQLPGGTWIDCRGDCEDTIKVQFTEFWDHQNLGRR